MRHLLVFGLLIGCDQGFDGDEKLIEFKSNLDRPLPSFRPATDRVAVGSEVVFRADDLRLSVLHEKVAPNAQAMVEEPSIFRALDAGVDVMTGIVDREGASTILWVGTTADHFTVHSGVAVRATLEDPYLRFPWEIDHGTRWPSPGDEVVLAPGTELSLEIVLSEADGGPLAHSPGGARATSDGGDVTVTTRGVCAVLTSADAGPTAPQPVALTYLGQKLGAFRVRTGELRDVANVELAALDQMVKGFIFLKATARLDGGATLWQAPVEWTYDRRLLPMLPDLEVPAGPRADLMMLVLNADAGTPEGADGGWWTTEVSARVGGVTATVAVNLPVPEPEPEPKPDPKPEPIPPMTRMPTVRGTPPATPGCGGCGASAEVLFALGALALARRRR